MDAEAAAHSHARAVIDPPGSHVSPPRVIRREIRADCDVVHPFPIVVINRYLSHERRRGDVSRLVMGRLVAAVFAGDDGQRIEIRAVAMNRRRATGS